MDQEQIIGILDRIAKALESSKSTLDHIASALDRIAPPSFTYDLSQYERFNWAAIGITVIAKDKEGPTLVSWGGKIFARRSPNNKYDAAIFYSRCIGKENNGENAYERLIIFKEISNVVEPLSEKAKRALSKSR